MKKLKIICLGIVLTTCLTLSFCLQAKSTDIKSKKSVPQKNIAKSSAYSTKQSKSASSTKDDEKMVIVNVVNFGRKNPFKPYKKYSMINGNTVNVGNIKIPSDIPPPPMLDPVAGTQLKNLMEAKVNGILYDPSGKSVAIINIKGSDYMVRRNDSIEGFYVNNISKNRVSISYGNNTYSVKVGDVIGQESLNYDPVNRNGQNFGGYRLPSMNSNGL